MGDYIDGTNWPVERKAANITETVLASVPEICLTGCKRVCALRDRVRDGLVNWHTQRELDEAGDDDTTAQDETTPTLGEAMQELSDFNNSTLANPCVEPGPGGECTQGQVPRLL